MKDTPEISTREGGLEAPTRHAVPWKESAYYDQAELFQEMERVFDICHGCRRCVNLCQAFPTLFSLVDATANLEMGEVARSDYQKVTEQCYLCDLCYMSKCPYVPPHPLNVDFPKLMLRAKVLRRRERGTSWRERVLSSTDAMGKVAGVPGVAAILNTLNRWRWSRKLLEWLLKVHRDAVLPRYRNPTLRKRQRLRLRQGRENVSACPTGRTRGKVALFVGCYGNSSDQAMVEDLVAVLEHNDIPVRLLERERCCGMPKMECGDLNAVEKLKDFNIPLLADWVRAGWDLVTPVPSCALMYRQELPLLFPHDENVKLVSQAFFDPCEYLMLRHQSGLLKTDFKRSLGKVAYHAACHQRVQNVGPTTQQLLELVRGTEVRLIERCSGHDGSYAVKLETHKASLKIAQPAARAADAAEPDFFVSDCPLAGSHIGHCMRHPAGSQPFNPFSLLCLAYGLRAPQSVS